MSLIRLEPNKTDSIGFQINEISRIIENRKIESQYFKICFQKIGFVHPTTILGISTLMNNLAIEGVSCTYENVNEDLQRYFHTVSFPNGIYPDLDSEWNYKLENFKSKNYLPIINFSTNRSEEGSNFRNAVLTKVNELIAFKLGLKISQIGPISYFLSELTDNVVEHSGVSRGRIMVQYYPTKQYLEICIIDNGKGILGSYTEAREFSISTDKQAIKSALQGKSTKSKERGYGIPTSLNLIVKGLGGTICLVSGSGMLVNQTVTSFDSYWKGTMLSIKIPNADKINLVDYTKFV